MFEKKSIDAKKVFRLENIIQNRLREEIPRSAAQLAGFSEWIDEQLASLEVTYGSFITHVSNRGSIGR